MDAAHINTTRKFASYTLAQLEARVAAYRAGDHPLQAYVTPEQIASLETEIANRKAGTSVAFKVPQIT